MSMSYREPFQTLLGALAALVVVEIALQRVSPIPPRILEVDDGVEAYAAGDPDTLVLGSSHTRSFAPLRDLVADRTHGANRMTLVPVEWGTFSSYKWVLDHRIRPLIEAHDASGVLRRPRLSRALIISTFYDLCETPGHHENNLPARAWTFSDFVHDVASHGLNDFNGNYLERRLAAMLPFSVLVQDRGHDKVIPRVIDRARRVSDEELAERRQADLAWARSNMEAQYAYCDDAGHKRSLRAMIDYFRGRHIEVTLVLFPLLPDIVTARSRATTLRRYDDYVAQLSRAVPIRVSDLTLRSPVTYRDFQPDLDHLTPAGNRLFSRWAITQPMAWLLEAPTRTGAPPL